MDAKPCVHCGKPVSVTAQRCPHCGGQGPAAVAGARAALLGCGFVLLLIVGFCAYTGSRFDEALERSTVPVEPTAGERARWDQVAELVRDGGATVEPFDPSHPSEMRIILPAGAEAGARDLAITARDRLGSNAIVFVKTPSGRTLARASSLGVE